MAINAIAIVIVTYNSAGQLPRMLDSLCPQLRIGDELHVVDCASPDDDPAPVLARHAPEARLTLLDENLGFAGGANAGARVTEAPLLLFLNPDCIVQAGALDALRAAAAAHADWGAWQALVTLPGGTTVNTAGGVTHWLGLGWSGKYGTSVAALDMEPHEVSFASGAALLVRRAAWNAVAGFEPAYFMYGEDLDLSLRLRLAGWDVGVVPAARVEHDYVFAKGDYKWISLERNRWWTVLGAYPAALLWALMPALLAAEVALVAVAARGGWLTAKLRAQWAVLLTLPWALRRRQRVQATRRITSRAFAAGLSDRLDSPFLGRLAHRRAVYRLQSAYWAAARRISGNNHG